MEIENVQQVATAVRFFFFSFPVEDKNFAEKLSQYCLSKRILREKNPEGE